MSVDPVIDGATDGATALAIRPALASAIAPADAEVCREWIAHHSKSFYLSSLLLPGPVRAGAWALYAFCRRADDAVDAEAQSEAQLLRRVDGLRRRLDRVYARLDPASHSDPIDRAYTALARACDIPRALPEELLAGMEMDARGTRYRSWDDLRLYCFRVASVVGLMMTRVMGVSRDDGLLRAADLGMAMQLTNIARDVGEDARRGRVYLPAALLDDLELDAAAILAAREPSGPIGEAVRRIVIVAGDHYRAAELGIPLLPRSCRLAIAASRHIYAAIGDDLAAHQFNSITRRARTSLVRKLWLVGRSIPFVFRAPAPPIAGPADRFLVERLIACGLPVPKLLTEPATRNSK